MKHKLLFTLGLMVLGMVAFTALPAEAVTGIGPYYAMPSWDQTLDCNIDTFRNGFHINCPRFIVLSNMNSEAVLDMETGLVWEQSPSTEGFFEWSDASYHCIQLTKGNRMGWRLPMLQELASLVNPNSSSNLALPAGHPFSHVFYEYMGPPLVGPQPLKANYVSATTALGDGGSAWAVSFFGHGKVNSVGKDQLTINPISFDIPFHVWCVRGGQGLESQ